MATKAIRNKALQSATRLVYATYKGEQWSTDTYFAIVGDIFADYKLRKDQFIHESQPELEPILDSYESEPAVSERPNPENELDTLIISGQNGEWEIQRRYQDVIKAYYPDAEAYVASEGDRFKPVKYLSGDKVIGVVMPLKR